MIRKDDICVKMITYLVPFLHAVCVYILMTAQPAAVNYY